MAYHPGPTNNTKQATFVLGFWNLVGAWLAAGWTIKASGDGLAAYNAVGSVFSNGGATGANGFDNSGAWLRIAMPGAMSGREFCIVRGSSSTTMAIAISPANGFVNGGSATVAATAVDQQMILGSTLTSGGSASLFSGTQGQNYYNAMADEAEPYNFYFFGFPQGNGTDTTFFVSDYLGGISSGAGGTDPDPYVYAAGGSGFWSTVSAANTWKGFSNGWWGTHGAASFTASAVATSLGNPFESGHDLIPSLLSVSNLQNSSNYIRGFTQQTLIDFHANTAPNHSLINPAGDKILIGSFAMPWDGSTPVTA